MKKVSIVPNIVSIVTGLIGVIAILCLFASGGSYTTDIGLSIYEAKNAFAGIFGGRVTTGLNYYDISSTPIGVASFVLTLISSLCFICYGVVSLFMKKKMRPFLFIFPIAFAMSGGLFMVMVPFFVTVELNSMIALFDEFEIATYGVGYLLFMMFGLIEGLFGVGTIVVTTLSNKKK